MATFCSDNSFHCFFTEGSEGSKEEVWFDRPAATRVLRVLRVPMYIGIRGEQKSEFNHEVYEDHEENSGHDAGLLRNHATNSKKRRIL